MKNGDNKGIIILMGVIIIILVVLCVLFATNTITFNNSSIKNNTNNRLSNDNKSEDDEKKDLYVIKYEEETYTTKNKDNIESDDRKNASITELTNLVKNINIDNVQKYINNAQKAINVISELTAKKTSTDTVQTIAKTPRVINKFFGD